MKNRIGQEGEMCSKDPEEEPKGTSNDTVDRFGRDVAHVEKVLQALPNLQKICIYNICVYSLDFK